MKEKSLWKKITGSREVSLVIVLIVRTVRKKLDEKRPERRARKQEQKLRKRQLKQQQKEQKAQFRQQQKMAKYQQKAGDKDEQGTGKDV